MWWAFNIVVLMAEYRKSENCPLWVGDVNHLVYSNERLYIVGKVGSNLVIRKATHKEQQEPLVCSVARAEYVIL